MQSEEQYLSYKSPDGRTHWLSKSETDDVIKMIKMLSKWEQESKAKAAKQAEADV